MDISNLDINITSVCATILLGVIALALAIFFGLRGFGDKFTKAKEEIIRELANIQTKIVRIDTTADKIWEFTRAISSFRQTGTKEVNLKYFGKTRISAEMGIEDTTYIIEVEKETIDNRIIIRASKTTGLASEEIRLFGKETIVHSVAPKRLLVVIPSVDPKLCTQYMNFFLKWLNEEYEEADRTRQSRKDDFEEDIQV